MDVFRLNFSHGTHDDHTGAADGRSARWARRRGGGWRSSRKTWGLKIRLGAIPGDEVDCRLGDEFTLVVERTTDDPHQLTCTYRAPPSAT